MVNSELAPVQSTGTQHGAAKGLSLGYSRASGHNPVLWDAPAWAGRRDQMSLTHPGKGFAPSEASGV